MRRRRVLQGSVAGLVGTVSRTTAQRAYEPLGRLKLADAKEVVVEGTNAYVATGDSIAVVDVSNPRSPRLRTRRTARVGETVDTTIRRLWDVAVDGDRLVAAGPAQAGTRGANGAVLFDISTPDDPTVLDTRETSFAIHNSAFDDGIVYLTANNGQDHPVVVLDTSGDQFVELSRWSLLEHDPAWESVSDAIRALHDVVVRNGIAYLLYWDAGTWLLDVSTPRQPTLLGRLPAYQPAEVESVNVQSELLAKPGNHHGGAISDDGSLFALSIEAWTVTRNGTTRGAPGGIELWDVSDPTAPGRLATIEAPASEDNSRGGGQFTTAHNCGISGEKLYTSWYFGGVKRHDISTPSAPREERWWNAPEVASFWTAQAVSGEPFFVAGSSNEGGATGAIYTFPDSPKGQLSNRGRPNPGDAASSNETPGFGLGATLGTLGVGAWQLRRLADRSD